MPGVPERFGPKRQRRHFQLGSGMTPSAISFPRADVSGFVVSDHRHSIFVRIRLPLTFTHIFFETGTQRNSLFLRYNKIELQSENVIMPSFNCLILRGVIMYG